MQIFTIHADTDRFAFSPKGESGRYGGTRQSGVNRINRIHKKMKFWELKLKIQNSQTKSQATL